MKLKKLATAFAACGLLAAGNANAFLLNWALDTNGAAAGGVVQVNELVDLVGAAYIQNDFGGVAPAPGGAFSFSEAGLFGVESADGGSVVGGTDIAAGLTASFVGTGTGTVGSGFAFDAYVNSLALFDGATQIASFDLVSGSGTLVGTSLLPNGQVSLTFKATSIAAGYFYRDLALADDLFDDVADGLFFGFATVNASALSNGAFLTPVANLFNSEFNPLTAAANDQIENIWIGNNGQFRISVPEPGSLALLGLGMAGLGFAKRRKMS